MSWMREEDEQRIRDLIDEYVKTKAIYDERHAVGKMYDEDGMTLEESKGIGEAVGKANTNLGTAMKDLGLKVIERGKQEIVQWTSNYGNEHVKVRERSTVDLSD